MGAELVIDSRRIGDDEPCYVIAEIGQNHQGSVEVARRLIAAAKEAGADAVKLQKRCVGSSYTRSMLDEPYTGPNSFGPTYGAHRERLELDAGAYAQLQACARDAGITLFATPFDVPSADFLAGLGMPAFKIASGDVTNLPLVAHVARLGRPVLVSTGGATLEDVRRAHDAIVAVQPRLCLLHCTAIYPPSAGELNLAAIATLRREFPRAAAGFSDHSFVRGAASLAYALGARVLERHFTFDRDARGSDHAISLEPHELRALVEELRVTREILGDGVKRRQPGEERHLRKTAKLLRAARGLPAGHRLDARDLAIKAPATPGGLPPSAMPAVVGRVLTRPVRADEALAPDLLA
jgi:sialic acid synthase